MPTPSGTAMINATIEVTNVPMINGNAPNYCATGSQLDVVMKSRPNFWRESAELCHNS